MNASAQEELVDAARPFVADGRHAEPVVELTRRFFTTTGYYADIDLARMVIIGLSEHGSQPHRARKKQVRLAKARGVKARLPHSDTLARRLIRPAPPQRGEFKFSLSHDPLVLARTFEDQFMAIIRLACEILGIKDDETYITIDSSPSANFGRLRIDHGGDMSGCTERGIWAAPIMRKDGPHFRGTTGGSEALHITLHTLDSRLSFPISIRQLAYEDNDAAILAVIPLLEALPCKPLFIVWDKEYSEDGAVVDLLRGYADRRGVWVVGPKVRNARVNHLIRQGWDEDKRREFNNQGERCWYWQAKTSWTKNAKGALPFHLVVIYEVVPDRYGDDDDMPGWIVQRGIPGVQPTIAGFALTSNFAVSDDTIQWFASVPPRRWGCEALFARYKGYMGKSRAQTQFPFEMAYGWAFLILGCYGLWRGVNGRDLPLHHGDVSHHAYLELLQADLRFIR